MKWRVSQTTKKLPDIKRPLLIEGLPGIGNVGKIAVDFLIDEMDAKKVYEIYAHSFPNSVFVNEKNLVELPVIEIFHTKYNKQDILFMTGDIQPIDEVSSYEFCDLTLEILQKFRGNEIITLGGIGLGEIPKKPKVYVTGNNAKLIAAYKKGSELRTDLYGVIGPIIGITGLLIALAERKKVNSVCILAETYAFPMFLGVNGAREIIKVLSKRIGYKINLKKFDKEIKELEADMMKKTEELNKMAKQTIGGTKMKVGETSYIG